MRAGVFLVLLSGICFPCHAEWRERRGALQERYQKEEFRIFYSLAGQDALPNRQDSNADDVPDYVDRIARELIAARELYQRHMRLRHPLKSPRYRNEAEFVDVNLLRFPLTSAGARHGIAYDERSSFDRNADGGRRTKVIVIDLSNDLPPGNRTAAHELFHLFQNGYTFFKNRWFTEGTARWVEAMDSHGVATGQLPGSLSDVHDLLRQTYETASFWKAVAHRVDPAGGGRSFIKAFLEELDRMDDVASAARGHGPLRWKEQDQMSPANDAYVWRALRQTLEKPPFLERWDAGMRRFVQLSLE